MTDFADLILSVTPENLTVASMTQRERQTHMQTLSEIENDIIEHHQRRCRFCGFQETTEIVRKIYKEAGDDRPATSLRVVSADGNPRDLSPANTVVSCIFCDAPNSLNTVEKPDMWDVIYLPGVKQSYLSWIARAMFLLHQIKSESDQRLDSLVTITDESEEAAFKIILDAHLGITSKLRDAKDRTAQYTGFDTAWDLAQNMLDLATRNPEDYANRAQFLAGFRIIPSACLNEDWTAFFKYRRLMFEATPYSDVKTLRHLVLIARQAYLAVYEDTFPGGDPLAMEDELGARSLLRPGRS